VFFGFGGVRTRFRRRAHVLIVPLRAGVVLASARPLGVISTGDAIGIGQATVFIAQSQRRPRGECLANFKSAGDGWPQAKDGAWGRHVVPMWATRLR